MLKINYKDLGRKIKSKRRSEKMTQEQLGTAIGISTSHLSHIENASTKASLQTLLNIANALDTSLDELFGLSIARNNKEIYSREFESLMGDCTPEERRFLVENLKYTKFQLRDYKKSLDEQW